MNPIYVQVNDKLREEILSGRYEDDQQFLTEREIAEQFGVSRITANKALAALVAEGLLAFRRGVGTFVRPRVLEVDLVRMVSFTQQAISAGRTPSTKVLSFAKINNRDVLPEVAGALMLERGESVFEFERVRFADQIAVIHEHRWLRAKFCPSLESEQLNGSLYELLTTTFGLEIVGADETLRAVALSHNLAVHLKTKVNEPALQVEAVGYTTGDIPLWVEITTYQSDSYEFSNTLGPLQRFRPMGGQLASHLSNQ